MMKLCFYLVVWSLVASVAMLAYGAGSDAVFMGRDNTRCNYDGKGQPVGLVLAGQYQDSSRVPGMVLVSPAVSFGRAFGATCEFDPPDSYGSAFCLDAGSLKPIWRMEGFDDEHSGEFVELKGFFSSPAVTADGQYVVYGQGAHNDRDSHLICFHAQTGRLHWAVGSELHVECSPTISGDVVVVGCGAIENTKTKKPRGNPGYLMAVRISDGSLLWKHAVNDPERSPAIQGSTVFAGSGVNGRKVVALRMEPDSDLADKAVVREIWSTAVEFPITTPITLSGGLVIAGSGTGTFQRAGGTAEGMVVALDQVSGTVKWKHKLRDSVFGAVAVRDSVAIVTCKSGEVTALNVSNGDVLWSRTPVPGQAILAGSAFTGSYIYTVTTGGYLIVLDAKRDGLLIQKVYINDRAHPGNNDYTMSTPTIVDGRLYVGSETGGLRCFVGEKNL